MAAISGKSNQDVDYVSTEPTPNEIADFQAEGYIYNSRLTLYLQIQLSKEMITNLSGEASKQIIEVAESRLSNNSMGALEHLGALQDTIKEVNAQLWIAEFENQQTSNGLLEVYAEIKNYKSFKYRDPVALRILIEEKINEGLISFSEQEI